MTSNEQLLIKWRDAARSAGHVFPEMAACEIAIESGWDSSGLIQHTNNAFGQKAPAHPPPGMKVWDKVTREVKNGVADMEDAKWVVFDTLAACFQARMALLHRLPIYAEALAQKTPEDFVMQVSAQWHVGPANFDHSLPAKSHPIIQTNGTNYQFVKERWSSDPTRGPKALLTYHAHRSIF